MARIKEHVDEHAFIPVGMNTKRKAIWVDKLEACLQTISNREYMVQEAHDELRAYYGIARDRLVDSVTKTSMESILLSMDEGEGGPFSILKPSWVNNLPAEDLEKIAGEDSERSVRREELKEIIENLEKGKKILRG